MISCVGEYLKDQPKWKTLCNQFVEASSKWLRVNEVGAYYESDTPITPGTPNTPSSLTPPQLLPVKIYQLKKLMGISISLEEKLPRER